MVKYSLGLTIGGFFIFVPVVQGFKLTTVNGLPGMVCIGVVVVVVVVTVDGPVGQHPCLFKIARSISSRVVHRAQDGKGL